jgi:hypothetical protein
MPKGTYLYCVKPSILTRKQTLRPRFHPTLQDGLNTVHICTSTVHWPSCCPNTPYFLNSPPTEHADPAPHVPDKSAPPSDSTLKGVVTNLSTTTTLHQLQHHKPCDTLIARLKHLARTPPTGVEGKDNVGTGTWPEQQRQPSVRGRLCQVC